MATCTWSWNGTQWVLASGPNPMPSSGCNPPTVIPRGDVPDKILTCGGGPGVGQGADSFSEDCCSAPTDCCESENELETVSLL